MLLEDFLRIWRRVNVRELSNGRVEAVFYVPGGTPRWYIGQAVNAAEALRLLNNRLNEVGAQPATFPRLRSR